MWKTDTELGDVALCHPPWSYTLCWLIVPNVFRGTRKKKIEGAQGKLGTSFAAFGIFAEYSTISEMFEQKLLTVTRKFCKMWKIYSLS